MNIKNYKNSKKKLLLIINIKNYSWVDLSLDLKILTLSASLTSFGSLFHSWAHLYVKEFLIKLRLNLGTQRLTPFPLKL